MPLPESLDQLTAEVGSRVEIHPPRLDRLLLESVQLGVEERHRVGDDVQPVLEWRQP